MTGYIKWIENGEEIFPIVEGCMIPIGTDALVTLTADDRDRSRSLQRSLCNLSRSRIWHRLYRWPVFRLSGAPEPWSDNFFAPDVKKGKMTAADIAQKTCKKG